MVIKVSVYFMGFPGGGRGKEPVCQCRRHKGRGFSPWVGKTPWKKAWHPTLVLLPGESHGQEHGGLQSMTSQRIDTTEATEHTHMHGWVQRITFHGQKCEQ